MESLNKATQVVVTVLQQAITALTARGSCATPNAGTNYTTQLPNTVTQVVVECFDTEVHLLTA